MSETISYQVIQTALERCMKAQPPDGVEYGLSSDASLLGDILGEMIWRRLDEIPAQVITGKHLDALQRWAAAGVEHVDVAEPLRQHEADQIQRG